MKLAPEGFPFIASALILSAAALVFGGVVYAFVPVVLLLFMLYFFRDPERDIPDASDIFVSPADGRIIVAKKVNEQEYLKSEMFQISIFMSPFNVHVNRVPCSGRVKSVVHRKGRFLAAYKDEASLENEHIDMILETKYGDVLARQVAGFVARRAVCRKKEGDCLQKGERYGVIKFSSRVDLYLPAGIRVKVKVGDKVLAGESVLGEIIEGKQ